MVTVFNCVTDLIYLSSEHIKKEEGIWPVSFVTSCWLLYCIILSELASPMLSQSF